MQFLFWVEDWGKRGGRERENGVEEGEGEGRGKGVKRGGRERRVGWREEGEVGE